MPWLQNFGQVNVDAQTGGEETGVLTSYHPLKLVSSVSSITSDSLSDPKKVSGSRNPMVASTCTCTFLEKSSTTSKVTVPSSFEVTSADQMMSIEPVPLKAEDQNYQEVPISLEAFAQDALAATPSSSLFRSPSFSNLFGSSTTGNNIQAVTCSTGIVSRPTSINARTITASTNQSPDSCDDCSSICSEGSVERFLESVFDGDLADLKGSTKAPQIPQETSAVDGSSNGKLSSIALPIDGKTMSYAEV